MVASNFEGENEMTATQAFKMSREFQVETISEPEFKAGEENARITQFCIERIPGYRATSDYWRGCAIKRHKKTK